jgi:hypothetical protein
MNHAFRFPQSGALLAAAMLACPGASVHAATLGDLRGSAVLGQMGRWTVQVQGASPEESAADCLRASVRYGDTVVSASRVRARLDSRAGQGIWRIESLEPVSEPVVTLRLELTCGSTNQTREYLLLADPPAVRERGAAQAPEPGTPAPSAGVVPRATRPPQVADGGGADAPSAVASPPRREPRERQRRQGQSSAEGGAGPAAVRAPVPSPIRIKPARLPEAKPSRGPRLVLDLPEQVAEPVFALRLTDTLAVVNEADNPRRQEAARMWRALNASPEDILRRQEQTLALEKRFGDLQAQLAQDKRKLVDAEAALAQSRQREYWNPLVWGLTGLGLALLGLLAWLLWRNGRPAKGAPRRWWAPERDKLDDRMSLWEEGRVPASEYLDSRPMSEPPELSDSVAAHSTVDGAPLDPVGGLWQTPAGAEQAEELFDVEQQAEFFISLGQQDQAALLLEQHIREKPQTSPMAYLHLFSLYHQLDRRSDYEQLRTQFQRHFTAALPTFDRYLERTSGLASYPAAMSRITALWPSRKVLAVIEESVFRRSGFAGSGAFTLEAYRDLLLLYAIAGELLSDAEPEAGEHTDPVTDFGQTQLHALPVSHFEPSVIAPAGVDIDLGSSGAADALAPPMMEPLDIDPAKAAFDPVPPASALPPLDFDMSQFPPVPPRAGR